MSSTPLPAHAADSVELLLDQAAALLTTDPEAALPLVERALQAQPASPVVQHLAAELDGLLGKPEVGAERLRRLVQAHSALAELQEPESTRACPWIGRFEAVACPLCGEVEGTAVWSGNLSRYHHLGGEIDPVRKWLRCRDCGLVRVERPVPEGRLPPPPPAAPPAPDDLQARILAHGSTLRTLREAGLGQDWRGDSALSASGPRLLHIGCGWGDWLAAASWKGFDVTGVADAPRQVQWCRSRLHLPVLEASPRAVREAPGELAGGFEVVIWGGDLGTERDPIGALESLRQFLAPEGLLLISASVLDHPLHRVSGPTGTAWSALERRQWFEKPSLALALIRAGLQPEGSWDTPGVAGSLTVLARRVDPPPDNVLPGPGLDPSSAG